MTRLRAALRAWSSYRGAPVGMRLFLLARFAVLPRRVLAGEFELLHGRVLSVGAGHGLLERWLAELNPDVTVEGLELDAERVTAAQLSEMRAPRVRLRVQDVRNLDSSARYDAAIAIDLIHHIPSDDHPALARALGAAVRPGGTVLVKDIARTPGWKHWWNSFHDRVVAGEWTTGAREPEDLAAIFQGAGFRIERCERVGRLSPYPHFVLRLSRVASD